MSTLSLPTTSRTAPSFMSFSLQPNTAMFQSPMNRSVQTSEMPGARWNALFGWNNLNDADARVFKAWLNKLSGMSGRFYLYDATHSTPAGTAQGTPLVKGAGQSGRTIITDGWTANQAALLLPGDYIGIGTQLCVITATASSDSSGNATLSVEPPLRTSPADNLAVVTTRPTCTMMLKDDNQDKFDFQQPGFTSLQIECMEVF
jgi:hypothetical protein